MHIMYSKKATTYRSSCSWSRV